MSRDPSVDRPQAVRHFSASVQQVEIHQSENLLPPPEFIHQYEQILPGSFDRILKLVEQEADHRRTLEAQQLRSEISETRVGQWMAFVVAIFTIGVGAYTALYGAQIPGALIGSGGVIGLVTVFIYGRRR